MLFEWDERKAAQNLAKHGVRFEHAARIFSDAPRVDAEDTRRDYREKRRSAIGLIEGRIYVVVYTVRGETVRLISARMANARERRRYYEAIST